MNRGQLVVLEGVDGSGKSTQLALLATALERAGCCVVRTREPHDCEAGRRIRAMARSGERVGAEQELAWFREQRRVHVAEVVEPALRAGHLVLSDRYFVSTAAYQGARGLDPERILRESEAEFPVPDLVLLLDLAPEVALERVGRRGDPHEPAFEERGFQERVRALFRSLERPYIERVDARGTPDQVARRLRSVVRRRLGLLRYGPEDAPSPEDTP